jgi:DNA repair protein RadA/Sms
VVTAAPNSSVQNDAGAKIAIVVVHLNKNPSYSKYLCNNCGAKAFRWAGQCYTCGERNTIVETPKPTYEYHKTSWLSSNTESPVELSEISLEHTPRIRLRSGELNRVLGGGLVKGSLVLLGGDPGIGKSTLLLQMCNDISSNVSPVLYISGEESVQQIRLRADRLQINGHSLHVLAETDMTSILHHMDRLKPSLVVIDSIQSVAISEMPSGPGTINQVRESALSILRWTKKHDVPSIVTGHVTKEGNLAGPKVLEHIVDVVLYLEGDNLNPVRLLRCEKNRYGSTNELGVLEMLEIGLTDVSNPSKLTLSTMDRDRIGSAVVPVMEGTRPMLVEVQALTSPSYLPTPRRVANGVDMSRLLMIIAVLSKRAGISIGGQDIIVNVVGGFRAPEPMADLAIALALTSSIKNTPIANATGALGEIGLAGELRGNETMAKRLSELKQIGFKYCIGPEFKGMPVETTDSIELMATSSLKEAIKMALPRVG